MQANTITITITIIIIVVVVISVSTTMPSGVIISVSAATLVASAINVSRLAARDGTLPMSSTVSPFVSTWGADRYAPLHTAAGKAGLSRHHEYIATTLVVTLMFISGTFLVIITGHYMCISLIAILLDT